MATNGTRLATFVHPCSRVTTSAEGVTTWITRASSLVPVVYLATETLSRFVSRTGILCTTGTTSVKPMELLNLAPYQTTLVRLVRTRMAHGTRTWCISEFTATSAALPLPRVCSTMSMTRRKSRVADLFLHIRVVTQNTGCPTGRVVI